MKRIRIWIIAIVCIQGLAADRASAQIPVAVERLFFSFLSDSQNNTPTATNATTGTINVTTVISTVAILTANVSRSVHYDVATLKWPTNASQEWTNLTGISIVREVNLTNGAEGIYLRGLGFQTNISYMFTNDSGASYSNLFTSEATNEFPGLTNNFFPTLPLLRGIVQINGDVSTVVSNKRSEQLFFASLNTSNLKFNYAGYGIIVPHQLAFRAAPGSPILHTNVDSFTIHGFGDLLYTRGSNVFNMTNATAIPLITNSGPMNGTFWTGEPFFAFVTNADGPITNGVTTAVPQ